MSWPRSGRERCVMGAGPDFPTARRYRRDEKNAGILAAQNEAVDAWRGPCFIGKCAKPTIAWSRVLPHSVAARPAWRGLRHGMRAGMTYSHSENQARLNPSVAANLGHRASAFGLPRRILPHCRSVR